MTTQDSEMRTNTAIVWRWLAQVSGDVGVGLGLVLAAVLRLVVFSVSVSVVCSE